MTIESIEESLRIGQVAPHELAEMRGFLASEYSYHAGQLQEILTKKPSVWNLLRKDLQSDKATDRAWEATEQGISEMNFRYMLKRIEKLMSGIKSLLSIAEGEARNQY